MKIHLDRTPFDETFHDLEYVERMPLNDELLARKNSDATSWRV